MRNAIRQQQPDTTTLLRACIVSPISLIQQVIVCNFRVNTYAKFSELASLSFAPSTDQLASPHQPPQHTCALHKLYTRAVQDARFCIA